MLRGGLIIASLGGLALVAWGLARFERDLDEAFAGAFGDIVELPAVAKNAGEGRRYAAAGSHQKDVIARRHVGLPTR